MNDHALPLPDSRGSEQPDSRLAREATTGKLIGGSLSRGLLVRLTPYGYRTSRLGDYVVFEDRRGLYYGVIEDIEYQPSGEIAEAILHLSSRWGGQASARETRMYYNRRISEGMVSRVRLTRVYDPYQDRFAPALQFPRLLARMRAPTAEELQRSFVEETIAEPYRVPIGLLRAQGKDVEIFVDLRRLLDRSIGLFGSTGSGKTFLAIPLIARIIHSGLSGVLIFDLHNDYGEFVKGDRGQHNDSLLRLSAVRDKVMVLRIGTPPTGYHTNPQELWGMVSPSDIRASDVATMSEEFGLSTAQVNALYALESRYGRAWFSKLMDDRERQVLMEDMVQQGGARLESLLAARRKLLQIWESPALYKPSKYVGFPDELLNPQRNLTSDDAILAQGNDGAAENQTDTFAERVIDRLLGHQCVVIQFDYNIAPNVKLLLANVLMREIYDRYTAARTRTSAALQAFSGNAPRLLIVCEEAHQFMGRRDGAESRIFSRIAREMRKFNVTLFVIDQRPSDIDADVFSQLGTIITASLNHPKDVEAIAESLPYPDIAKVMIQNLNPRQHEFFIGGYAIAAPVRLYSRDYRQAIEEFKAANTLSLSNAKQLLSGVVRENTQAP